MESAEATSNMASEAISEVLPLTDRRGRCQCCGNHCRPVRSNCKKRQKALAKLGY